MKVNTLIVGTSKSLDEDVYYKKSKNRFWGIIKKSNGERLFS